MSRNTKKEKNRIEKMHDNFVRKRGGKLISIEAYVLAAVVCYVLIIMKDVSPVISIIIAFVIGFVFPILVGTFKFVAWIVSILFSLIWGLFVFFIVESISGGSGLSDILAGIVIFAISFFVHKIYAGLSFHLVRIKKGNKNTYVMTDETLYENVSFCPKCGRRINNSNPYCEKCD